MTDAFGNNININDNIVYIESSSTMTYLRMGTVIKITNKYAYLDHPIYGKAKKISSKIYKI